MVVVKGRAQVQYSSVGAWLPWLPLGKEMDSLAKKKKARAPLEWESDGAEPSFSGATELA